MSEPRLVSARLGSAEASYWGGEGRALRERLDDVDQQTVRISGDEMPLAEILVADVLENGRACAAQLVMDLTDGLTD